MKILISAPYMLRDREKVEPLLKKYPSLSIDWANVYERLEEEELLSIIDQYDALICGDDRFTRRVYEKAKKLKVIVKWGTGIDSLNIDIAKEKNIALFRTANAFTVPVSETTLALILNEIRNIRPNDNILKRGGWDKPNGACCNEIVVGVIGLGNIGSEVVRKLSFLGCQVMGNDIKEDLKIVTNKYNAKFASKREIFESCDFITLHCDLNETSHYILNKDSFSLMKKRPYIINTARGGMIKEDDLILALELGQIRGAGLDVFEIEPLPLNSPLRKSDKVTLSSHNSNSSAYFWEKVHRNSIEMLARGLKIEL